MTQFKPVNQQNQTLHRVVLLAADSGNSVMGDVVSGKSNRIAYSAYGERSAQQDVDTNLGFNGQLRETTIGWYLLGNGYRAYNPRLMRFHSPDSWSPFGRGGLNAYMYCGGSPVMKLDPTGHVFFPQALSNFISTTINTMDQFKALRTSGVGTLNALKNAPFKQLSLSGGNLGRSVLVGNIARPSGPLPFRQKGGLISNMNHWDALDAKMRPGYSGSSTPVTSDSASIWGTGGGGSMWDRLAARDRATQAAYVSPNYGPSRQVAVVKPQQSTPQPSASSSSTSSASTARNGAEIQPYRPEQTGSTNSTWSGESGPSDWSVSSSNSSIRGSNR